MTPIAKKTPSPEEAIQHIRVGIGGWNFAPWRNNFYPGKWPQRRELEYASGQLTAIEVNSTFYGTQKPTTYANWRAQTPDGFVFSLKAPQFATMAAAPATAAKIINGFIFGGLTELGDRLGPLSWQFPPNRQFDHDALAAFLDLLPLELNGERLRHVLEVRNETFKCEEYVALARERNVPTVFTDSPRHPSFADLTGDFVYARLMRSESAIPTGYSDSSLDDWSARAQAWASGAEPDDLPRIVPISASGKKGRDVFIYFISAAKERNPAAARALIERFRASAPRARRPTAPSKATK